MSERVDISIDQAATFSFVFDVNDNQNNPIDLSGYTANAMIRKYYASNTAVVFTAEVSNASIGEITLSLTANQTAEMEPGRYVYDATITSAGGAVTRVIEGVCTLTPDVTRA